jgi:thimet oligopeptidase
VIPGIRGRQMPEGVLICNFSGGVADDPGLMLHGEVRTFFHEFGHLMHQILGGQGRWSGQGGLDVERDFVEAPSQMLEEFMSDYSVLSTFAKHYKTGETIPAKLVERMKHADSFGRATSTSQQLFFANYALQIHNMPPGQVNPADLWQQGEEHFEEPRFVEGDRGYQVFNHLSGYSSNYYTYVLDKIIAIDFFGQFDKAHPLDGPTAMRYRKTVLQAGATKRADQIVQDFLGRPQSADAMMHRMLEEFDSSSR